MKMESLENYEQSLLGNLAAFQLPVLRLQDKVERCRYKARRKYLIPLAIPQQQNGQHFGRSSKLARLDMLLGKP